MSEGTKIQWADDTANFWRGCAKVSPGCAHCYAEKNIGVKMHGIQWGKGAARVRSASAELEVRRWNRKPWVCDGCGGVQSNAAYPPGCPKCGNSPVHRRRVFSLSLGDWLDEEVPIEWLAGMLKTIQECPDLDFLLLTKRPENFIARMRLAMTALYAIYGEEHFWISGWLDGQAPANVWLGVSVENQAMADLRIPQLLKIPAAVRFLSCEPLLGPVDLRPALDEKELATFNAFSSKATGFGGIDWVIVGGESGPKARACHMEWVRSIVQQCQTAWVACFVKQLGADPRSSGEVNHEWCDDIRHNFKDKKGGDVSEWPDDLRVRQFPEVGR